MNKNFFRWITFIVVCFSYTVSYAYDLNNDGYEDIVVSSYYESNSYIFYGLPTGYPFNASVSLPTMYSSANTVFDLNKDGYIDIVFCNSGNGTTTNVNSYIYWGSQTGYSTASRTELPTHGASGVSAYDLNYDGYPDILFSNNSSDANHQVNSYIYWGSLTGFSADNKLELPTKGAMGNFIADLNKDGFLDIIFCNNNDGSGSLVDSYIYWGSETGFSADNKTELPTKGAVDCSVKDLNKDGYFDIVFSNNFDNVSGAIDSYIYWGSASGFSAANRTGLLTSYARANAIADIDNDTYDDIVFCNMRSGTNYWNNSYIYWGDPSASYSAKTEIQTFGADGVAVADVNNDGHLDIFIANKTINGTSPSTTSYIYWGSSTPRSFSSKKYLNTGGATGITMGTNSAFGADYRFLISQNDQDLDGLPDKWEQRNGTNPYVDDASDDNDNDGLDNLSEYNNNTNPQISDTDNDGLNDGDEVNIYHTMPVTQDTDGDGLVDGQEVLTYHTDPFISDSDNDAMPDKWEVDNLLNPVSNDAENDNDSDLLNNLEEYNNRTNPHNSDTDNDGLADGAEINYEETITDGFETGDFSGLNWFVYSDNEAAWNITGSQSVNGAFSAIASQDSIAWSNTQLYLTTLFFDIIVPRTAQISFYVKTQLSAGEFFRFFVNQEKNNETQGVTDWTQYNKSLSSGGYRFSYVYIYSPDNDSSSYAVLDEVTVTYYGLSPLDNDCDNDGLKDGDEINIYSTSPFNPDSDFDGMGDKWELDYGFNPLLNDSSTDSDNDGLLEYQEFQHKTNPLDADTDNDGVPDKFEVDNNTDPLVDDAYLDLDNDGVSNGDEFFYGTIANNPDSDADGIYDGAEINSYGTNPLLSDSDNDGLSDNMELFIVNTEINLTGSSSENLYPSIATNGKNYMLTWLNYDNDGDVGKILYNILDKRGNPLLEENQVLTNYQTEGSLESSVTTESGAYLDLNTSSGYYEKMACRFVAGKDYSCRDISLKLKRKGNPDGFVYISLNLDNANSPGTELARSGQINSADISADGEWIVFSLDSIRNLTAGNIYWIVLKSTYAVTDDCVSWEWLNSGSLKNWSYFNGVNWAPYFSYTVAALYKVSSIISPKIEYNQMIPQVCSDGKNYLITWQNWHLISDTPYYGIYAQIIDGNGNVLISPTQLNSITQIEQKSPACASNGNYYLISWQIFDQDNDTTNIHYHYLDNEGALKDKEYLVMPGARNPKVASVGKSFYMVWDEIDNDDGTYLNVSSDGFNYILLRENDSLGYPGKLLGEIAGSDGERLVKNILINDNVTAPWANPVSASNGLLFMALWESDLNDENEWDIYGRLLDFTGRKLNGQLKINHISALNQKNCSVASCDDYFVSAWSSEVDNDSTSDILVSYIQWGFGSDPLNKDTDNDGMPDGWEVFNKLDPLIDDFDNDVDNDGLNNLEEFQNGSSAYSIDTDADGLSDYEEVKVIGTNPNSKDSDNDGIPDKWEYDNSLSPLDNDSFFDYDNDGLNNLNEYKNNTNPYSSDTDNDGMPDKYEVDYATKPDQADADEDADNDTLSNYDEFLLGTFPNDNDYDNDGMIDGYEVHKYGTNPKNADTDNDGLTDYEELLFIDDEIIANDNTGLIQTNPFIASNGYNYLIAWKSADIQGNVCLIKHKLLDVKGKSLSQELVTAAIPAEHFVEYVSSTGSSGYLDLNNPSGGGYQEQAARFVAQRDFPCGKIDIKLIKKGSPQGNVFVSFCVDASGYPGAEIVQSNMVDVSSVSSDGQWVEFNFNEVQQLANGSVYWIVLKSDYTAGADCLAWEWQNTSPNWSFKTGASWANYASYTVAAVYRVYFTISPLSEKNHMRPHISSGALNYLVTWQTWEYGPDGGYYKIMGQIVNSGGGYQGLKFQINTDTSAYQLNPVSAFTDNKFLVLWEFYDSDNDTTDIHSRYVDPFSSQPEGQEYVVSEGYKNPKITAGSENTYFVSDEADNDNFKHSAVASNGTFFMELNDILNGSHNLQAQLFTKDKVALSEPVIVAGNGDYPWNKAEIASNSFNYLAVWDTQNADGNGWGIKAQFISVQGNLENENIQINHKTNGNQKNCSAASFGLEYIVVWEDDTDNLPTSDIMVGFVKWGIGTDPLNPDTDNDGLPDQWEYINYTDPFINDADNDMDNDRLTNEQEYENGSFAYLSDSDNDGLSDYEEIIVYKTDPVLKDTDNDGMPDKWELDNILNPLVKDSQYDNDGDGFDNYDEFDYRTDPHNPDTDNDGLSDSLEASSISERFKINTYTLGRQHYPSAAADGNEYIVAWESKDQDGNGSGIFAQRITETGVKEGAEFTINTYTTDDQWYPVVSSNGDRFIVVWDSEGQDLNGTGLFAQALSGGGFMNNEFKINTYTYGDQIEPVIVSNGQTYYVCWNSNGQDTSLNGVFGQLIDSSGTKIGQEQRLNDYLQDNQQYPKTASNGKTYFVVWESDGQDGEGEGVYGRVIDNDGSFLTTEIMLNDYTPSDQWAPVVISNGYSYLAVWSSKGQDGSDSGVYASLFDNEGNKIKNEFRINIYTTGQQVSPMLSSGGENYLIAWTSYCVSGLDSNVYARIADNEGQFLSLELQVNTKSAGLQKLLGVSSVGLNYLVVWDSIGEENNLGMFGQILGGNGAKIGPQFQITDYPLGNYYQPSISHIDNGYLITYTFKEEDNEGDLGVYGIIINTKYDPNNPDYDNDGLLDGDEINLYHSNPASTDSDGDGISDGDEVNLYNTHPDSADTDNDGLSDYEELNNGVTDPLNPDSDNDTMYDGWEIDNNFDPSVDDGSLDRDNDGVPNNQEFLNKTDPDNPDTDNDGLPDIWEIDNMTNPIVNDSANDPDNDGLDNFAEYSNLTNPNLSDTDGDGQNDGNEIFASTDPLDSDSVFAVMLLDNNIAENEITLIWSVEPNMDYLIYWSVEPWGLSGWDIVDYPGLESDIIYDPNTSSCRWTDNGNDPQMNGMKPSQVDNRYYKIRVLPN